MLRKLLKYEFKATGRILFPLYCVLLAFAVIIKLFLIGGYPNQPLANNFKGILFAISLLGYGFSMAAIFVVTLFVIIQRFYKNLLGDEGYLMHTLPVAPWQNITSKLLTSMVWTIISGIIALITIFIFSLGTIPYLDMLPDLFKLLGEAINTLGIHLFLFGIEGILIVLSQMALGFTLIYASISIGHLFNKRRILASFGAFIGLNIVMNMILGFGAKLFSFVNLDIHLSSSNPVQILSTLNIVFLIGTLINIIFFAGYFAITNYVVKRHLNLE